MKPAIILRKLMLLLAMLSAWPALSAVDYFMVDGIAYHITDASKAEVEVNLKLYRQYNNSQRGSLRLDNLLCHSYRRYGILPIL